MLTVLTALGRTAAFSFAAGINLYATVAILGLASRYGWVDLPPQYRVFDNTAIIVVALALYAVEFFADKIPWIDSMWDAVHTVVRPIGGALIAVATLGHASPTTRALVALLGASLAASTHVTKSGSRALANLSPEPFSNWALSFAEDGFVAGLALLALKYPAAAAVVVLVCLVFMAALTAWFVRFVRRRFLRRASV
ncbi:MAG TPA: DUF4126 domain-containing protein [Vicinamibacterales bacterium]|nr:DUF4126 domain-containing protein [Vicinamibacterales bacterium]